jgi:type IV pilus assembly protein PilM
MTFRNIFKNIFTPPTSVGLPFAGLNIGNRKIKFIQIADSSEGSIVENHGEIDIPSNIFKDGEILNKPELVKYLSSIKGKLKTNFVKVSIPEEKTYVFNIYVPQLKDDEIRQAIEFKIEENVPLKVDEVSFEYKIIKKPNSKKEDLLIDVFVVPKKVIDDYSDVLYQSGLLPISFEIESLSAAKSVVPDSENNSVLIVNIKDNSTVLSVYSNKVVWFTTTIPLGNFEIEGSLMKTGKIKDNDFDTFIKKFINDGSYDIDFYYSLLNIFSIIKDEVEKVNEYWSTHIKNSDLRLTGIKKIILCGKNSALPGFVNHVNQNLGLDTSLANVWCNVFSTDNFIPNISFIDSLDLAVVVGLSISSDHKQ